MSLTTDVAVLQNTPTALQQLLTTRRADLARIAADKRLSDVGRTEARAAVEEKHRATFADLQARAAAAQERVQAELARQASATPGTVADATLQELQAGRIWARQKARLDSGTDPQALIQETAAAGDRSGLQVLRAELAPYLTAARRGHLAAAVGPLLDAVEQPLLSPPHAAARDQAAEVARGCQNVVTALNHAEYELTGHARAAVLPGWEPGSVVPVADPPPPQEGTRPAA